MGKKLTIYDPAEDLDSADAIAVFLSEAFRTEDAGYIAHALGVVARAKGNGGDRQPYRPIARPALSLVQCGRQPSPQDDPGRHRAVGVELIARPPARRPEKSRRPIKRALDRFSLLILLYGRTSSLSAAERRDLGEVAGTMVPPDAALGVPRVPTIPRSWPISQVDRGRPAAGAPGAGGDQSQGGG